MQARRGVLGGIIGAAALLSSPRDASAAFGDAARVSENDKIVLLKGGASIVCCTVKDCERVGHPKFGKHLSAVCMCRSSAVRQQIPQGKGATCMTHGYAACTSSLSCVEHV